MSVDLDDVPKRVFGVNHLVGLLAREIRSRCVHPAPATVRFDASECSIDIRVLNTEMEDTGLLVVEIVDASFGIWEFEDLQADTISEGQVRDPELAPTGTEDLAAHEADGRVLAAFLDCGRRHDQVAAEDAGIEANRLLEIGHRQADMGKAAGSHNGNLQA